MKRLIYILPFLLMLAGGCLKDGGNYYYNSPDAAPLGTFSGEFRLLHRKADQSIDTLRANIKVIIEPGGYRVLGDTSTIHAGSRGLYGFTGNGMKFADSTLAKTGTPVKTHLDGEYLYIYNGSIFQMVRTSGDTLSLQYDLKKTN
jgi:hypothetical protein